MARPRVLKLTSCQSENAEYIGRAVAKYIAERLRMATEFVSDVPWQERERLLEEGEIHAGWICGLPYVRKADSRQLRVELVAAPVMAGIRYGGQPVYFSDVVVRRDSAARSFADLRGARWAYNEPGSHSGHGIVCYQLARLGERAGYFATVTETGAHQRTISMIAAGEVDASAIDSTVLEMELRERPALASRLRVVDTWGPSPAPPWVVSCKLPLALRHALRRTVLSMHQEKAGCALLRDAGVARFAGVTDRDYDPIRRMAGIGSRITLQRQPAMNVQAAG